MSDSTTRYLAVIRAAHHQLVAAFGLLRSYATAEHIQHYQRAILLCEGVLAKADRIRTLREAADEMCRESRVCTNIDLDFLPRNFERALDELCATIRQQLLVAAPPGPPVTGLTEARITNLARTILSAIEEYGRTP